VVNDLLEDLQKDGFQVYGYADDVAILVAEKLLNTVRDLLTNALKIIQRWYETNGLTANPLKTDVMVFTRKYKPEPQERLRLGGKEIAFTRSVKYLGVLLDRKLNWKQHLTERRKKIYSSVWSCRGAMCSSSGISSRVVLWLYKTVLLPHILCISGLVLQYMVSRVEAKNLLRSLQDSYPRAAVGSVKTTPTEAPEVALCLPSVCLFVIRAARFTAYRFKCQGEWRNTGLGQPNREFLQQYPFTLKQDGILKKYQ